VLPSKLFIDLKRVQSGDNILDIGSGGGFPGMIIALLDSTIQVTLTDSIKKKTDFLQLCVEKLNLKNVTVYHGRVESMPSEFKHKYDHVTARAVAPLATLWRYAQPLLKPAGTLEAMKGTSDPIPTHLKHTVIPCPGYDNTVIVSVQS